MNYKLKKVLSYQDNIENVLEVVERLGKHIRGKTSSNKIKIGLKNRVCAAVDSAREGARKAATKIPIGIYSVMWRLSFTLLCFGKASSVGNAGGKMVRGWRDTCFFCKYRDTRKSSILGGAAPH